MAENLMKTPWEERNAAPGFGYAGGTQDILTAYNGLNHRTSQIRYKNNQPLLKHLIELKQELEQDEDKFFKMFGIIDKDKKKCFNILKQKVKDWDNTGAKALINDRTVAEFWNIISIIQRQAAFAETPEAEWSALLTETFEVANAEEIRQILENNPNTNIAYILNQILQKDKPTFSTSAKSTLVANMTVTMDEKGNIKIASDREKITPTMQLKLVKELKKYLQTQEKKIKPNYNFKQMFDDIFVAAGINATGQKYIKMALSDYQNVLSNYAFSSNKSQIKGFLGEVYNNAFLLFMADGKLAQKDAIYKITPTGILLNQLGQEIIIDTWLEGFGIQVKNYELNKVMTKGYETHKSHNAGQFITEVLQLNSVGTSNTASVGDILLNFFTAYDYNQDYGKIDPTIPKTDAYKYWQQTRARMHEKINDTASFTNILMPYVDKILGIDKTFSTKNGLFDGAEKYYRNAFFNISGNYIPSSYLVQSLIDTLEKKKNDSLTGIVQARFHVNHKPSGKDIWNPGVNNNVVDKVFAEREQYADASRIGYSITIDVNELVNYLLQ